MKRFEVIAWQWSNDCEVYDILYRTNFDTKEDAIDFCEQNFDGHCGFTIVENGKYIFEYQY